MKLQTVNAFVGRQFDWLGKTARLSFLKFLGWALLFTLVSLTPFLWIVYGYIQNEIDFGPAAADVLTVQPDSAGFLIYSVWRQAADLHGQRH